MTKTIKKEEVKAKKVVKPKKRLKKAANPVGRPLKDIDYELLDDYCFIHCTGEEICHLLGIDYDTLNRRLKQEKNKCFTEYYAEKSAGGKKSLRRRQYEMAQDNPTMAIWVGKNWLKQGEMNTDFIYEKAKAEAKGKLDALKESAGENSSGALKQYIEQQIDSLIVPK